MWRFCGILRLCHTSALRVSSSHAIQNAKSVQDLQDRKVEKLYHTKLEQLISDLENIRLLYRQLNTPKATLQKSSNLVRQKTKPFLDNDSYHVSNVMNIFLDVCNVIGDFPLAIRSFKGILEGFRKTKTKKSLEIKLYHNLLRIIAKEGELGDFEFVWNCLVNDKYTPDSFCYIALIQCIKACQDQQDALSNNFVQDKLNEMEKNGITLHSISQAKGFFTTEEDLQDFIGGAKLIDPDFVFKTDYFPPCYEPKIVQQLNRKCLKNLTSATGDSLNENDFSSCFDTQFRHELSGFIDIPSITSHGSEETERFCQLLCNEWRLSLSRALEKQIARLEKRARYIQNPKSVPVYPFFKILPIEDFVEIMIKEVTQALVFSENYSPASTNLQVQLGHEVMKRFHIRKKVSPEGFSKKMKIVFDEYFDWFRNPATNELQSWCHREAFSKILTKHRSIGPCLYESSYTHWPHSVKITVGRELFHILMNELMINVSSDGGVIIDEKVIQFNNDGFNVAPGPSQRASCPALYKLFRVRQDQKNTEEVKPHPALAKLFCPQKFHKIRFLTNELPMLVPSVPWMSTSQGGFLLDSTSFVRAPDEFYYTLVESAKLDACLHTTYPVFDSLNQLGSTPWKINGTILDLVAHVFKDQINPKFTKEVLSNLSIPMNEEKLNLTEGAKIKLLESQYNFTSNQALTAQKQAFYQMQRECFSLWCNTLYGLSIANYFRNNVVFFPHNIDFRGRVYPLPPHFNHMGNDLSRSLLIFAKGKPLGPEGLNWLKTHCVNLTGKMKKQSVTARLAYAEENIEKILSSANDPLGDLENSWWVDSDEPWQTLAACIELRNALLCENPEQYVSHLPIHQDGSCNGLQHYAALGRDTLGGRAVNVLPSDKPQDVYSEIANIVNLKRAEDEKNGHQIAAILNGFVDRKVIKQTVMTTVYGVTSFGAKLQIARQLNDLKDFPPAEVDKAAKYLAKKTFESLNEMFTASQQIQTWFTDCANVISGMFLKNVEWETPLGLTVIQPYSKKFRQEPHQRSKIELSSIPVLSIDIQQDSKSKPNTIKQRNGFPPNFVHSLDSTHMMLTSLHLWDSGLTFASVHDCYWTHASSVKAMNVVCREQFVALHSQPILESLSTLFLNNHLKAKERERFTGKQFSLQDLARAEILFKAIPGKGDLDLEKVKESIYFFS